MYDIVDLPWLLPQIRAALCGQICSFQALCPGWRTRYSICHRTPPVPSSSEDANIDNDAKKELLTCSKLNRSRLVVTTWQRTSVSRSRASPRSDNAHTCDLFCARLYKLVPRTPVNSYRSLVPRLNSRIGEVTGSKDVYFQRMAPFLNSGSFHLQLHA